jgi:hypothetical protein
MPKILLEFDYPEQETECRQAVNSGKAFGCLTDIRAVLRRHSKNHTDPEKTLEKIKDLVEQTLQKTGDGA